MTLKSKIILLVTILFLLVGCDYTTKQVAQNELKGKPGKSYLNGSVKLIYAENSGGMLSLGDEMSEELKFFIFRIGVGIVLLAITVYVVRNKSVNSLEYLALILFVGGGIGNLIDRIFNNGHVVDFIVLQMFGLQTGIFNLADFYVMIGTGVLIFSRLFLPKTPAPSS